MRRLVRPLTLCLVLSIMLLPCARAAADDAPLSPPSSVFALPSSLVGKGARLYTFSGSAMALGEMAEYDLAFPHQGLFYEATVSEWISDAGAKQPINDARKPNPVFKGRWTKVSHPAVPGEWLSSGRCLDMPGWLPCLSVSAAFRNLAISVDVRPPILASSASTMMARRMRDAQGFALQIEAALITRAKDYAAQVESRNGDFLLLWQEVIKLTNTCRGYSRILHDDVVTILNDNSEASPNDWQSAGYAADQVGEHCNIQMYEGWQWTFPMSLHRYSSIRQAIKDEDRAMILYKDTVWPDSGPSLYFTFTNTLHPASGPYVAADPAKGRRFLAAMDTAIAQDQSAIGELEQVALDWGISLS